MTSKDESLRVKHEEQIRYRLPFEPPLNRRACGPPAEIIERFTLDGVPTPGRGREARLYQKPLVQAAGRPGS
jgi:hypothetical protein